MANDTESVPPTRGARTENLCPECGSDRLQQDFSRGEVSCGNCGIVIEDRLVDTGPDWRAFTSEQRGAKERTGAPLSVMQHDLGLGTVMWGRTDAHGKSLRGNDLTQMRRLQKWDRRS